jgi:tetratricopeptide (TPR) repeat protein
MLSLADAGKTARIFSSRYLKILAEAEELYLKGGNALQQGLSRFDQEQQNIQAAQEWSETHATQDLEAARLCAAFPVKGPLCLSRRLKPQLLLEWAEAGLSAARRLKDRCAEATNLGNLGSIYVVTGKTRDALALFEQSLEIARDLDSSDCHAEANALCYLGNAYLTAFGNALKAREYYEQWLVLARKIGDRRDESIALGNLGSVCEKLGDYERAGSYYKQRLEIAKHIGDRKGEGDMLTNLGVLRAKSRSYEPALECFNQALAIARELRDDADQYDALTNIGNLYVVLGKIEQAEDTLEQCIGIGRKRGDALREGMGIFRMSQLLYNKGNRSEAIANAKRALNIIEPLEAAAADYIRAQLKRWSE